MDNEATRKAFRAGRKRRNKGFAPWQLKLANIMFGKTMETVILVLIILYTCIIFVNFVFEDEYTSDVVFSVLLVEVVILCLFIVEISLKTLCMGKRYIKNVWNLFDITMVLLCFVLAIVEMDNPEQGQAIYMRLRALLRLVRIVIMFRKVNELRKMKEKRNVSGGAVTTPVEKVIDFLHSLKELQWMDAEHIDDIEWAIHVISNNKLYEPLISVEGGETNTLQWLQDFRMTGTKMLQTRHTRIARRMSILTITNIEGVDNLDFSAYALRKQSDEQELVWLMQHLFQTRDLFADTGWTSNTLKAFTKRIQQGYRNNPYHNQTHATDVVQTIHWLMIHTPTLELSPIQQVAAYLAASVHDFDHPGVTNPYLVNTSDALALRYNDKSVLESYHIASSWQIGMETGLWEVLSPENLKTVRSYIISMVLATDASRHFSDLARFKGKYSEPTIIEEDDKLMFLESLLHSADISNPVKPWETCERWALNVLNEFFAQGDRERDAGLPISYLCDRFTVKAPKSQLGFIDVIVSPLFEAVFATSPGIAQAIENKKSNHERWTSLQDSNTYDYLAQIPSSQEETSKNANTNDVSGNQPSQVNSQGGKENQPQINSNSSLTEINNTNSPNPN